MGGMRRFSAAALALALVGGLSACGDDDDGGGNLEAVDDEETTTTDESGDDETTTTEGTNDTSVGDIDFGNLDECLEFASAYASLGLVVLGGALGGETADLDVDEVISQVEDVAAQAPSDVQDAFEVVLDTYQEVFSNLEDAGIDLNDAFDFANPEVAEAFEPLNSSEFTEANEEVSAYLDEQCSGG